MEWNDKLATNIEMIDVQHQEIIRRINDVLEAGKHDKTKHLLYLTIELLRDYCATHFSQEENLQLRSQYPQYKEHKKLHTAFLDKVKEIQVSLETQEPTEEMAIYIESLVGDWLIKHIDGTDKVLAKYLFKNNFLK